MSVETIILIAILTVVALIITPSDIRQVFLPFVLIGIVVWAVICYVVWYLVSYLFEWYVCDYTDIFIPVLIGLPCIAILMRIGFSIYEKFSSKKTGK